MASNISNWPICVLSSDLHRKQDKNKNILSRTKWGRTFNFWTFLNPILYTRLKTRAEKLKIGETRDKLETEESTLTQCLFASFVWSFVALRIWSFRTLHLWSFHTLLVWSFHSLFVSTYYAGTFFSWVGHKALFTHYTSGQVSNEKYYICSVCKMKVTITSLVNYWPFYFYV